MGLPERLKELEEDLGLTVGQLAALTSASEDSVYKWRAGTTMPNLKYLVAFSKNYVAPNGLKINLNWLLNDEGQRYVDKGLPGGSLIYKDVKEGGYESRDREGLFGKTRRVRVDGAEFSVTTHDPPAVNAEAWAIQAVIEIYRSDDPVLVSAIQANLRAFRMAIGKDRQLSEQTAKIENLEVECEDLKKRISALEAKLLENDPNEVPGQDPGERKAASSL